VGEPGNDLARGRAVSDRHPAPDRHDFPKLGKVAISDVFGGAVGLTVHGIRRSVSCAKACGSPAASAAGAEHLGDGGAVGGAQHPVGDERWRLFSPFELSGQAGRPAGSPVT